MESKKSSHLGLIQTESLRDLRCSGGADVGFCPGSFARMVDCGDRVVRDRERKLPHVASCGTPAAQFSRCFRAPQPRACAWSCVARQHGSPTSTPGYATRATPRGL